MQADRVEAPFGERRGHAHEGCEALLPGGDRVGLVEAADVGDLTPQPFERRVGLQARVDEHRPIAGGPGHDRPVGGARVDERHRLGQPGEHVERDQLGVDPVERVR